MVYDRTTPEGYETFGKCAGFAVYGPNGPDGFDGYHVYQDDGRAEGQFVCRTDSRTDAFHIAQCLDHASDVATAARNAVQALIDRKRAERIEIERKRDQTTKRTWVVRIVTCRGDDPQFGGGLHVSGHDEIDPKWVHALAMAGYAIVHRDDESGMCFDLIYPGLADHDASHEWSITVSADMRERGINAVNAPAWTGE